jgi:probable HAF family extracellular repeat protein
MAAVGRPFVASLVVAVSLVAVPAVHAQYVARDLGALPDAGVSQAEDVNNRGEAVGISGGSGFGAPTLWTRDGPVAIGTLDGFSGQGFASGINNRGQVVGTSRSASGHPHAFLYEQGVLTDLGTLPGVEESYAADVNERGDIAGGSFTIFGQAHLVLWVGGVIQDLGVVPFDDGIATALNNRRQIVGYSSNTQGNRAWSWQDGSFALLPLPEWATSSFAWGLNDRGDIVGTAFGPNRAEGVVWTADGAIVAVGTLPGHVISDARAINNRGQVVGWSQGPDFMPRAFLWHAGRMIDLGTLPGGTASFGFGINDAGAVVGASNTGEGGLSAAVWTRHAPPSR